MSFHKLDKAKDKNFWSVRVNARHPPDRPQDRRQPPALLRRSPRQRVRLGRAAQARDASHDRRRAVRRDPRDGQGDRRPGTCSGSARAVRRPDELFAEPTDDELLGYGVPREWLGDVRKANEDELLDAGRPPARRGGRGAARARDGRQAARTPSPTPWQRTLRPSRRPAPLPRHDERRGVAARARLPVGQVDGVRIPSSGNGSSATTPGRLASPARPAPARPSSRCTGPLHLARAHPDARVLLTTFSDTLAHALQTKHAPARG